MKKLLPLILFSLICSQAWGATGQFGLAFDFAQTNNTGFSSTDIAAMTNIRTLSVGAWTAPDSDGDINVGCLTGGSIFQKRDAGDGWCIGLDSGTGPVNFRFAYQWTGGIGRWTTDTAEVDFTPAYQHLAVTYSATATTNDPIFYYNGVSQPLTKNQTTP